MSDHCLQFFRIAFSRIAQIDLMMISWIADIEVVSVFAHVLMHPLNAFRFEIVRTDVHALHAKTFLIEKNSTAEKSNVIKLDGSSNLTHDILVKLSFRSNETRRRLLGSFLWYLQYNFDNPDLQNKNLRKALAYAVDRDDLTQNVLKDGSIAAEGFVTRQLSNGPDGKDYRETADDYFLERGEDSDKIAQEAFEQAKKELGKDEITLRFLFEPSNPSKSAAEFMQSEFAKLDGLNIEMVSQEKNVRLKSQQNGDFDLVLTRWGPDYADPTTYLNVLLPGGSFNFGKYDSQAYKDALDEAANASSDEARWQALQKAEKIAMDDIAVAPIFQTGASDLLNPKVKHLVDNPVGVPFVYKYVTIEQ